MRLFPHYLLIEAFGVLRFALPRELGDGTVVASLP
jgi:hypothetical protein